MSAVRGPYRKSVKRQADADERRQAIKKAARTIFAEVGLDGTSASAIVAASGLSTGTFYNYYGTKEAVFDDIIDEIIGRIDTITAASRRQAETLDAMFLNSYHAFLQYVVNDDLLSLIERNQYHARIALQTRASGKSILAAIREDIARAIQGQGEVRDLDLTFIANVVISNGLDAALTLKPQISDDIAHMAHLMASITVGGIERFLDGSRTPTARKE